MIDEYFYLTEKEFDEISDKEKWQYVLNLKKAMEELKVQAEKNCAMCEQQALAADDLNVDLFMEDYRECKEHCESCGKEQRVAMCELQYEINSHLAEEMNSLRNKFNGVMKYLLKKDAKGQKLIEGLTNDVERIRKSSQEAYI